MEASKHLSHVFDAKIAEAMSAFFAKVSGGSAEDVGPSPVQAVCREWIDLVIYFESVERIAHSYGPDQVRFHPKYSGSECARICGWLASPRALHSRLELLYLSEDATARVCLAAILWHCDAQLIQCYPELSLMSSSFAHAFPRRAR